MKSPAVLAGFEFKKQTCEKGGSVSKGFIFKLIFGIFVFLTAAAFFQSNVCVSCRAVIGSFSHHTSHRVPPFLRPHPLF